ncbi:hypothetical protein LOAG_07343 [Loa loa]|uniref:Uncharacterized protein n=1 Tax=Loa loa TaxID=7209 RepID=A0A1S0TVT0_LOALO|nr:hypothetical protein LOAG_07343 [Loa loa]EFO21146.1 hypothetical protein LOAG_07343 [Loa loa]
MIEVAKRCNEFIPFDTTIMCNVINETATNDKDYIAILRITMQRANETSNLAKVERNENQVQYTSDNRPSQNLGSNGSRKKTKSLRQQMPTVLFLCKTTAIAVNSTCEIVK